MIITYYGKGEGKTCAAIGRAVRAAGQGKRVVIIHFMKGRKDVGEYKYFQKKKGLIKIYLTGLSFFLIGKKDKSQHLKKAKEGLKLAEKIIFKNKCDLLILDEILYAIKYGLIEEKELLSLIKKRRKMHIILTGKYASKRIFEISDQITRMDEIKHYYQKQKKTIKGLDY